MAQSLSSYIYTEVTKHNGVPTSDLHPDTVQAAAIDLDRVYSANRQSVAETLAKAHAGQSIRIQATARALVATFMLTGADSATMVVA